MMVWRRLVKRQAGCLAAHRCGLLVIMQPCAHPRGIRLGLSLMPCLPRRRYYWCRLGSRSRHQIPGCVSPFGAGHVHASVDIVTAGDSGVRVSEAQTLRIRRRTDRMRLSHAVGRGTKHGMACGISAGALAVTMRHWYALALSTETGCANATVTDQEIRSAACAGFDKASQAAASMAATTAATAYHSAAGGGR